MLIDTHCHLTDAKFDGQIDDILKRAQEAGVGKIIVPTTGIMDARRAVVLAEKYESVWVMAGIHPENVSEDGFPIESGMTVISELSGLIKSSKKVVGIGEIGLDFYLDKEKRSKEIQMRLFQEQLELALKLKLPVMVHMREAEAEMAEIINQMEKLPPGQFHCWAGSQEFLELVLAKGFHISFCGNITYKSATNLRALVKLVSLERLLLETDSPYLPPEGRRNTINEPANVKILAEYIADLLKISPETLINQTTHNSLCLFFGG